MSRLRHQAIPSQSPRPISIVQIPTMVSKAQCSIVFAGGRSFAGTESRPVTCVLVLQPTRNESSPGMPIPPLTPFEVQRPKMYSVTSVEVCWTHSIAANLTGWSLAIARAAESPTANWIGRAVAAPGGGRSRAPRGDGRHGERDQQAHAVVAVASAAEHPYRIHRRHQEAGDEVRGQDHVRNLVRHRRVEDHLERVHGRDVPVRERVAL